MVSTRLKWSFTNGKIDFVVKNVAPREGNGEKCGKYEARNAKHEDGVREGDEEVKLEVRGQDASQGLTHLMVDNRKVVNNKSIAGHRHERRPNP